GLRGVGGRCPLLEFLQRQPAVRVRVPEDVDYALALLVGCTDRSVGHRRTFPRVPIDPNPAPGGTPAAEDRNRRMPPSEPADGPVERDEIGPRCPCVPRFPGVRT